jgi:hypothetical protein
MTSDRTAAARAEVRDAYAVLLNNMLGVAHTLGDEEWMDLMDAASNYARASRRAGFWAGVDSARRIAAGRN